MRIGLLLHAKPMSGFRTPDIHLRNDGLSWKIVCEGVCDSLVTLHTQSGCITEFPATIPPGTVAIEISKHGTETSISAYAELCNEP